MNAIIPQSDVVKFAVDWLKERRQAIYDAFKSPRLFTAAENKSMIEELVEIESALEGDE